MIDPAGFARGFFVQARSDWDVYRRLSDADIPACHCLHYLQMCLEKLGKALRLVAGSLRPQDVAKSHLAFSRYLQVAGSDQGLAAALGMASAQLSAMCRAMRSTADALERLHPQLATGGAQLEYPWIGPGDRVFTPATTDYAEYRRLSRPAGLKLLRFVERCIAYHATATFA